VTDQTTGEPHTSESYGLHAGVLGPVETLAQSVSAMAPTTSAALTIPLVFALAGNATWFVYLLATGATLLIGFCVSRFARLSASPGSLYTYTADTLPPMFGAAAAWGLLLAYVATGASVAGGALYYATVLAQQFLHLSPNSVAALAVICAMAAFVAYRDVKLSAELMLWIEAASITLILILLIALPLHLGVRLDVDQLRLKGASFSALGPALVLAIFSFAGFESATTLGGEAREPLRTIPRAVMQCALLAGVFFILCSYSGVIGLSRAAAQSSSTTSPMHLLAAMAGIPPLGVAIDFGTFVSMFAGVLACTTAAARVMMRMSHEGMISTIFQRTSQKHGTPGAAVMLSALLMFAGTAYMALRGSLGSEMYDVLGSLAVFGFLTAYALVAAALPFARRARGQHSNLVVGVCIFTIAVILLIVVFDLESSADAIHAQLPWLYLAYLAVGLGWFAIRRRSARAGA
jgi:amino acid transporter